MSKAAIALIEAGVTSLNKQLAVEKQNVGWYTTRILDVEKQIAVLQREIGEAIDKRNTRQVEAESLEQQIADLHAAIDTLTQSEQ
jgi:cell division protein FtsB